MNAILKSKSMRLLSALLAVLMIVAMLPTSAFAWSAEEGTKCTSTYGDKYLGSDGDNYYSKAGNTLFYNDDGSFYVSYHSGGVARYKYLMIDSNGTSHHVYCIESGVSYNYSDTYNSTSGKNSKYFQNLPVTAQYGIMMALMYGWHDGASSPVAGTNVDDFIYATQCIIWEYQQQIRTSPTSLASANGVEADLFYATLKDRPAEKCYDWILEQMSRHYVVPSFSSRNQSNAQTYTMMYDQANDNYSITLTDTNNTLADINFSASGITVTRSGNQYTFTSKNMISNAVMISAQKKTNLGMGKMLIWGCPGKQTMASGAEDPVFFYFKLNTETKGVGHIVKTSEDGKVEGIKFTITGNGINETVTTGKNGTVDLDLLPGTYTVTELPDDKYETQSAQTVTIVSGKTSTVTFNNTLRRGDLKVTKTSEDGLVEGMKFHLCGTSYRCTLDSDNLIIFGHNMRNGTMFSTLKDYLNEGRLASDPTILLETEDGVHEFTIFAVACVDKLDSWYSFINAESEDAFNEAVQRIIQNAYYTNGDAPEYGDRLLTLSTCYGSTRSSRLIIIAKEEKANVWKTEIADAGTDGGNSDEGLLRYDFTRLREILVRPLCCWRQLPICVGYPRISPLH